MNLQNISVVLPSDNVEDMPLDFDAAEAEQLLSAWTAPWHPAILNAARTMPRWTGCHTAAEDLTDHLVILPACCREMVSEDWPSQVEAAGGSVVNGGNNREQIVAEAFRRLNVDCPETDGDLTADFFALGFTHLMVDLLTRHLRYMSNLDEDAFEGELVLAAKEAMASSVENTRDRLRSAFELLHESREYFYPVEAYLIDLTLLAPSTLGQSLHEQLSTDVPCNLIAAAATIEELAERQPETLSLLDTAMKNNTAALIGGEDDEGQLPLLPLEAIASRLQRGNDKYRNHLSAGPSIFGRRRFGLTPALPQVLRKMEFVGSLHFTLDDGRFPTSNQSRTEWLGFGGKSIEALSRLPIDVSSADAMLRLPERLGSSMDLDNIATAVFAHWPGTASRWYEDMRRVAEYSPVLGNFVTITDYFEQTSMSGQRARYTVDEYRSPYLLQAVGRGAVDPISRWVRYYRRRASAESIESLRVMSGCVGENGTWRDDLEAVFSRVDDSIEAEPNDEADAQLDEQLQSAADEAVERFAKSLGCRDKSPESGLLVLNPSSSSRRLTVPTPRFESAADVSSVVRAADMASALVDVPSMGFAWIGPGSGAPPVDATKKRRRGKKTETPPLAEDNILRNEFFEITVDPHTGALRAIKDFHGRGARLAQQIAMRDTQAGVADPADDSHYSIMAADELVVTSAGPLLGEIVTRGRLVDREAATLARFTQTTRLRLGSRVIEIGIELGIDRQPQGNPWGSYYAARFAWHDAAADMFIGRQGMAVPSEAVQIETPEFIDIRSPRANTTLLFGGLPYHRRFGMRKLDTLLVVPGERERRFRLGIGIDLEHPPAASVDFITPPLMRATSAPPSPHGWLFHLDSPNVSATHWETFGEGNKPQGFRVRLLETEGFRTTLGLRSFGNISTSRIVGSEDELPVEGDRVTVELTPHEWTEIETRFGAQ